jgi:RibD C-terminal domain
VVPEHRSDGNGPQHVRSGPGPWGKNPWNGWWGNEPPFHHPVYVLTHHACDPVEMQGGTSFHFVIDGIESALGQAQEAADGKDVSLGGGANVAQQYLTAGLIDEMEIRSSSFSRQRRPPVRQARGGSARARTGSGDRGGVAPQVRRRVNAAWERDGSLSD